MHRFRTVYCRVYTGCLRTNYTNYTVLLVPESLKPVKDL